MSSCRVSLPARPRPVSVASQTAPGLQLPPPGFRLSLLVLAGVSLTAAGCALPACQTHCGPMPGYCNPQYTCPPAACLPEMAACDTGCGSTLHALPTYPKSRSTFQPVSATSRRFLPRSARSGAKPNVPTSWTASLPASTDWLPTRLV